MIFRKVVKSDAFKFQIPCQYAKHQWVTDIINPLGLGVKVSFTILEIIGVTRAIGL
jgi:hypothetical protein